MSKNFERGDFKEQVKTFGPAVVLVLLGFILAYQFVDPAPPRSLVVATGHEEGAYSFFGRKYREILGREEIDVGIRTTAGSLENLRLLSSGEADIAFVQGGTGDEYAKSGLHSLGSLYYEPLWVFHRSDRRESQLTDLRGRRLAIGPEGSGTRALVLKLLDDNGISEDNTRLLDMDSRTAVDALKSGQADVTFLVASPRSLLVQKLAREPDIHLMSFQRAEAYTRIHRFLSKVTLPQGVLDLPENIPSHDIVLLAPTANLVVSDTLHPAIIDLLLLAGREIHGKGDLFETSGEFPAPRYLEFPLHAEARRFYEYGPPLLQRFLPFWAASFVDRLKVMLLPLLALMIPLFKLMPPVYTWRMRSRIYRWYRELQKVDRQFDEDPRQELREAYLSELDRIDHDAANVSVPLSFAEELFELRTHVAFLRRKIEEGGKTAS